MTAATLLIVDDESAVRSSVRERLARDGCTILEAKDAGGALARLDAGHVDLVLLDDALPDGDGASMIKQVAVRSPDTLVILMTESPSAVEHAVQAIRLGAWHCVNKPLNLDDLALLVDKAFETTRLRREVRSLKTGAAGEFTFDAILGTSPAINEVKVLLARVASSSAATVLLTGETGTGKDLAAKTLHYNSDRAARRFVNITCSALPEQLLETELFGHERGAFTDAHQQKRGLFEVADGGTLLLDEIGELTAGMQAKLLRVLEEKAFKRVGGLDDVRVDVRVIAATNKDLEEEVKAGRFREDLFYRLHVMSITLPPLRDRGDDAVILANHYVERFNRELKKKVRGLDRDATSFVRRHGWSGNIRELRNAIERVMLLTDGESLTAQDFASLARPAAPSVVFSLPPGGVSLEDVERQLLVQALERSRWNQTHAGQLLKINRDQVRYRIEKFGLRGEHASR